MNQVISQAEIKASNGNIFKLEELKQIAVSRQKPGSPHFILFETPNEEYLKLTLPGSGKTPMPAEVLPSEIFYKILLQDNVELK